jgi:hypothetical protein
MRRYAPGLVLGAVLAAVIAGFAALYRLRVGQGDIFPAYSSLRADPLGTRVFHDSLAELPGLRVGRRFRPLAQLEAFPPRVVVLAGLDSYDWKMFTPEEFTALDAAVRGGSRLVIALGAEQKTDDEWTENKKEEKSAAPHEGGKKFSEPPRERDAPAAPAIKFVDLARVWGVELKRRWLAGEARRASDASPELPEGLRWGSDIYFQLAPGGPWRVLYERGGQPVLLEMPCGRGSIVLAADSYFLSNEALQKDRPLSVLAWIVGSQTQVEFDESHLGVVKEANIAELARHYGLEGAFFTLLLLAALFVWQRMVLFVPPPEEAPEVAFTYNQAAGLEALLRRALPAPKLAAACVAEWRRTARPADLARADSALAACPKGTAAVDAYNAIARVLRRR